MTSSPSPLSDDAVALREKVRTILDETVDAEIWGPYDDWVRVASDSLDLATDKILKALQSIEGEG